MKIITKLSAVILLLSVGFNAQAGHLFTQAALNTSLNLTGGTGIDIPQDSMEPAQPITPSNFKLENFDSGDIMRIELGGLVLVFDFDNMPTGWTATDTVITGSAGNDPAVAALNLAAPFAWRIDSVAGDFTLEGYRIYTANGTVNGAGAGLLTSHWSPPQSHRLLP